ncbi:hypothetical protein DXA51_02340 [Bacteroides caccae]|uniref:Virulence protein n=1 Tax=Bacteroides caccae TaxID=47678 RepID=A0A413JC45_9BACE|nr:hypothetical protein [Bacteroides caccae]RGY17662.1 hypothetical protein DXA51_02340 [Bacteroides caccae]RGY29282.1 hypothetical protein DXA49_02885 [Bacteroides caccae]
MERGIIAISETGTVTMPTVSVWMTQQEIADLFGVFSCDIRKAIHSIYKNKELNELDTMKYLRQAYGISYDVYSLEMIIAIAFRICSKESVLFRQFIISKVNARTKEIPITLFVSCGKGRNLWYS